MARRARIRYAVACDADSRKPSWKSVVAPPVGGVLNRIHTIETTARYPIAHGSPVHVGDPSQIGIENL